MSLDRLSLLLVGAGAVLVCLGVVIGSATNWIVGSAPIGVGVVVAIPGLIRLLRSPRSER